MAHEKRLYGHRGACVVFPENTLEAFEHALKVGANCIESDVHQTLDGEFVLHHDPHAERMSGVREYVKKHTLEHVQAWNVGEHFRDKDGEAVYEGRTFKAPTFGEALDRFEGVRFNVDVKVHDKGAACALVDFLKEKDVEDRVTLASFDAKTLGQIRAHGFKGETAFGRNDLAKLFFAPRSLYAQFFKLGDAVQVPPRHGSFRFDNKEFVQKCHDLGLRVDYWTINDIREGERLLELGADGLMSDDPEVLTPLFSELQPSSLA